MNPRGREPSGVTCLFYWLLSASVTPEPRRRRLIYCSCRLKVKGKLEVDGKPVGECLRPDARTHGHPENIMPATNLLDEREHKMPYIRQGVYLFLSHRTRVCVCVCVF